MKRIIIPLAIIFAGLLVEAQSTRTATYGTTVTSLNTTSTGAVTGTAYAVPSTYAAMITWQVVADGSALSVNLQGSQDNSNWSTVDTQTTAAGGIKNFGFTSLKFIRCSAVSRTGGTGTTCTIVVNRGFITSSAANLSRILTDNGSGTTPAYSFVNDSDTGFFKHSVDGIMQWTTNGTPRIMFGSSIIRIGLGMAIGWSSTGDPAVANDDIALVRNTNGIIQVTGGAAGTLSPGLMITGGTFANLGGPANGIIKYCSDCTIANPCAASGTGAFAKRLNGVWVCN